MNDIQLGIKLTADARGLNGSVQVSREQFRQLAVDAQKAGEASAGGFTSAARGVRSISDRLEEARLAAAGYFSVTTAISGARWALEQESAIRAIDARLKVATSNTEAFHQAQAGVFELANRYGQAVSDTASTFARLNPAVEQLGGNVTTTQRLMEALAASVKLSGGTSAESGALMLQFSQAMGSGVVQGDEFRSMMETASPLMREVGAVLGKTTGELRKMSEEGKLTSEVFGNAVLQAVDRLKAKAEAIPATMDQAAQAVRNSLARMTEAFLSGLGPAQSQPFAQRLADGMSEALPQARALGETLREMTGTVTTLAGAYIAFRAAAAFGPMIEGTGRAALATGQLTLAVHAGRAVDLQSAEALHLRAAAARDAALAAEAAAVGELAHLQVSRDALIADRALAQSRLAAANAQAQAAASAGSLSVAYKLVDEAARAKSVSMLHLADVSRGLAVVERDLAAAQTAAAAASGAAATATRGYEAAAAAATLGGRAKAAAINLASGALAAMGGPMGAAILGLTALAWWLHSSASEAGGLEKALDAARLARERLAKEKQFGSGEAATQREAIAGLQKQIAEEQSLLDSDTLSSFAERRVRGRIEGYKQELAAAQSALTEFERRAAVPADTGPTLSDAGAFDAMTKQLAWKEKLQRDHLEKMGQLETAALAKLNAAKTDADRRRAEADYLAAKTVLEREFRDAVKALPDEKALETLLKGRAANYLRILDDTQRSEIDVLRRGLESGAMGFDDYASARRSLNAAFANERAATLQKRMGSADVVEQAAIKVQLEQFRQQAAGVEQDLKREQEVIAQRRGEALRAINAEASGQTGSAVEKAGADFGRRFQQTAIRAASDGDTEMATALEQLWERIAGRAQFADAKSRFEALQAELQTGVEKLRTQSEGQGLAAWLNADAAEQSLRARLLPALADTQAQMQALAGTVPNLVKATEDAGRALQQAQIETRKLGERTDWTVGVGRGMETYGKQAMDVAGQIEQAFGNAARSMEDAWVKFAQTGKFSFTDLANSVIADLLRMQVRAQMSGLMNMLGSAMASYFGGSAAAGASWASSQYSFSGGRNLSSMGGGQGLVLKALGGAYGPQGAIHAFAQGGVVDRPTLFRFANGGGFSSGLMGEAGPEAILPLRRGADGRLGVAAGGGGGGEMSVRVEIHNDGTPQEVTGATPTFDATGTVVQIFTRDLQRNGPMAQALTAFKGRR